jgi:fumarylacetoacetase
MIKANDPARTSWVEYDEYSDFPIQNIPFGIGNRKGESPRVLSAIGNFAVDLAALESLGYLAIDGLDGNVFHQSSLNSMISSGKENWSRIREAISEVLRSDDPKKAKAERDKFLIPLQEVELLLPVEIGDYTDFYSSKEHATNVGTMFRDPNNALLPNWKHIPVGYHGRASSIVVSGTPVRRPKGQQIPPDSDTPVFGPSKLLDFELEVAFIVGRENELGSPVNIGEAEDHIFGLALFNDWSARDIQKWEYVPLGPFLGKNFASTMSPWIVTMEALEPFRVKGPEQDPEPLPYLRIDREHSFDIDLEVWMESASGVIQRLCRSNFKYMYWNMAQQLAHHTVNGCNLKVGDVCASGTISGPTPDAYGSMLEISWRGTKPVQLADGTERKFIQDGDTIILHGHAEANGVRIGFGEARGVVLPVLP